MFRALFLTSFLSGKTQNCSLEYWCIKLDCIDSPTCFLVSVHNLIVTCLSCVWYLMLALSKTIGGKTPEGKALYARAKSLVK
jgi:hypothetical protein